MSMMIGIGTPSSQSSIPRPMSASFFDSGSIVAPSKRASTRYVPAKHTAAPRLFPPSLDLRRESRLLQRSEQGGQSHQASNVRLILYMKAARCSGLE